MNSIQTKLKHTRAWKKIDVTKLKKLCEKIFIFSCFIDVEKLKFTQNHCKTDCAKLWKKWFHENDHTNCSNHIETKNAIKRSMQWNVCAKCSQNLNTNVTEKHTSRFVMQNKKSFNVQKHLNFAKQLMKTLKTKKNYKISQNKSKTKIICLKNCSNCWR